MTGRAGPRRWFGAGVLLATAVAAPGPARAELLQVRQVAAGMECPECARGLRVLVNALDGVEEAATSWNRRILTVRLRSGNHATLDQIRAVVVKQHFVAREADVVVAGALTVDAEGGATLVVTESGSRYRLTVGSPHVGEWISALGARTVARVVVTGRVPPAASAGSATGDLLSLSATDIQAG